MSSGGISTTSTSLGVFTAPEKFQAFVEKKSVGPSWARRGNGATGQRGNGDGYLSTSQWEFVASSMNIDAGT
jgi:hypothetical protein